MILCQRFDTFMPNSKAEMWKQCDGDPETTDGRSRRCDDGPRVIDGPDKLVHLPGLAGVAKPPRHEVQGQDMPLKMNAEDLMALMGRAFPQVAEDFDIVELGENRAVVRLKVQERHLRPGGTVSGPSLFALADVSIYVAVMAMIGPKSLSVTTSCSIDFMRKPDAETDLVAHTRLLKLGRSLAVGDVLICPEGSDVPVARASLTYAIPPAGSAADVDG